MYNDNSNQEPEEPGPWRGVPMRSVLTRRGCTQKSGDRAVIERWIAAIGYRPVLALHDESTSKRRTTHWRQMR